MTKLLLLIIFSLMNYVINSFAFTYPELKLISMVFRHGDREPNDEIAGDLTKEGRARAYGLGEALRQRYGAFLDEVYDPATLAARSTEYARAKMSLQLLLAALYVPRGRQRWHSELAWQPVPFTYVPEKQDILLFPKSCPRFVRELASASRTPEFQRLLDPYREMMSNLTFETKQEMKTSYDMFMLYHKLASMKSMNQSLPAWADGIFPNGTLLQGTYLAYDVLKYTDWMRRINGGALVRKMIDDMLAKTKNEPKNKRKIFLYSAHEMNIVAILQTLKVWKPHIPEYSSAVVIELREDGQNYYVKVLYHLGIPATFRDMQIRGCPSLCPLSKFIELISDQLPAHDEIICDDNIGDPAMPVAA